MFKGSMTSMGAEGRMPVFSTVREMIGVELTTRTCESTLIELSWLTCVQPHSLFSASANSKSGLPMRKPGLS